MRQKNAVYFKDIEKIMAFILLHLVFLHELPVKLSNTFKSVKNVLHIFNAIDNYISSKEIIFRDGMRVCLIVKLEISLTNVSNVLGHADPRTNRLRVCICIKIGRHCQKVFL